MAPRKKKTSKTTDSKVHGIINGAGEVVEQPIVSTIRENFMPYAMSVILSRAIPEIDGFKPSHRKLLYTMYKMGLLKGSRTKSANIVGATMKLNPHGDAAIYDTMVRLSRGYEALLHPYVDSKGNFGKFYSRDMAWAASRYTEAKLAPICAELFNDIDKDTVDFVDNYDNTMKEPTLLPARFPSVLVNTNTGIAVGMGGCQILYDEKVIEQVYETGRGSIRLRARYNYDKSQNCIDILSIPSTTTSEVIIEKIIDLVKQGRIKEIADIRDETGLDGLKITIDLKRNVNPDVLMAKLFKLTTLEDSYACNFNVLIGGVPMVLGVKGLLNEWIAFRMECVRRRTHFDRTKKAERLHLLEGLAKILLDIDKAIKIIRETDEEIEVVPNLMIGFGIDKTQAEYVAEIKLRHLNREYILKRTQDIEQLEKEIAELDDILKSKARIKTIIVRELKAIAAQYGEPRRSIIIYEDTVQYVEEAAAVPDYACTFFFTKEGYFKKITPQSLRMSGAHKLKDGDEIMQEIELSNNCDLLFFTDKAQVYKAKASDFSDTKTSVLGDYVAAKLGMDEGENAVYLVATKDYKGLLLFAFENGKAAKVPLEAYATKTNRKKLTGAYSDKAPMTAMLWLDEDKEVLFSASSGRMLLIHTGVLTLKATRTTQGVAVMKLKKGQQLIGVKAYAEGTFVKPQRYRTRSLPGLGALPTGEDKGEEQLSLI